MAPGADLVFHGHRSRAMGFLGGAPRFMGNFGWIKPRGDADPGLLPTPVDDFPVGSRWIMALAEITEVPEDGFDPSTPNQSYGRPFDFVLSSCGAIGCA
ncbi:MAG: hypothetical protein CM15mP89_3840 [Gammaproteobacteria bacterium]|nr:MAG: hypothetical protein CM15mP89_3840 [Gammaproteobacteria bacterium]